MGLHRNFIALFFAISLLTACGEKELKEPRQEDLPYAKEHAHQVQKSINDFLGKGYKGYGLYADPESCTLPLFDVSNPEIVNIQEAPSYKGRFASGESKFEYYERFAANIAASGKHKGFSAEIISNFSKETLRNRANSFVTSHVTQTYYHLTLLDSAPLTDQAKADIAMLDPMALFEKYGTHYLKSIYIGGRISFNSFFDRSQVSGGYDVKATVNAAFAEKVKASAEAEGSNRSAVELVAKNRQVDVIGGDPAEANNIETGDGSDPAASYNTWSRSVPNFMSISDFADGGMVPLYELASDAERYAVLEAAWKVYMEERTADILEEPEPAVIKKNATVQFKGQDGRYVGIAPYKAHYDYYYPTVDATSAVNLVLDGGADALENGHILRLKTSESFSNSITGKWSKRVYLGAFNLKHWLYYWDTYGAKTDWTVEKFVPSSDSQIRYGDQVRVKNAHFNQYLAPSKDGFLTTIKETAEPYTWTILPVE